MKVMWVRLDLNLVLLSWSVSSGGRYQDTLSVRITVWIKTGCSYFCRPWRRSFRRASLGLLSASLCKTQNLPKLAEPSHRLPPKPTYTNIPEQWGIITWAISWDTHEAQSCRRSANVKRMNVNLSHALVFQALISSSGCRRTWTLKIKVQ